MATWVCSEFYAKPPFPAVRNTRSKRWACRRDQGTALPWHLALEQGCGGTRRCRKTRVSGATHGAGRRLSCCGCCFPWQRHGLFVLSFLLFMHRNRTRSHRAELGRAALLQPPAHGPAPGRCIWALPASFGQERLLQASTSVLDRRFAALGGHDQIEIWRKRAELAW